MRQLKFKLQAPNVPGDTMVMQGRVVKLEQSENESRVTVDFAGRNSRGVHISGAATLALAS